MLSTRFKRASAALLPLLCLLISLCAPQAMAQDVPQRASVQRALDALGKSETLTVSQQADQKFLTDTLSLLDSIEKEHAKAKNQTQRLRSLPGELRDISAKLDALTQNKSAEQIKSEYARMSLAELESRQPEVIANMQDAQETLGTIGSQLTSLQTLPERAQTNMSRAYQRSQEIRTRLNVGDSVSTAEKMKLGAELALLELQLANLQQQLDNRTSMQDLAVKQRDYQNARLANEEQKLQLLQEQSSAKRLGDTEKTAEQTGELVAIDDNPLVQKEQELNHQLSQQLVSATTNLNNLVQKNLQAKSWLERGTQTERNLNEQVQMLKGNLLLSRILYQLYQQLESAPTSAVKNLEEQIADLHLAQFELSQQRDQLFQKTQYLDNLIANSSEPVSAEDRANLSTLLDTRISLLDQLNRQLDSQLTNAISLQLTQQQLARIYASIEFTLQQHIFWVSSNKPIDVKWFINWPAQAYKQVSDWVLKPDWDGWGEMLLPVSLLAFPLLLVGGLLIWKRPSLLNRQKRINKDLGRFRQDSQWHTPRALLYTVLQRLPGSLFILAAGLWLTYCGLLSPKLIFQITLNLALGYLVFSVYLAVMRPGGIAESHFRIPKAELQAKRTSMRYLWLPLLPLIMLSTKAVVEPSSLGNDVVGQALTLLLLGLTTYLVFPISRTIIKGEGSMQQSITAGALALAPVALMVLVGLGYYYTALKLTGRLVESFYLLIIWSLVYRTSLRGLELAARRLAYRRAVAKREHKSQEDAEGGESIEEQPMDLEDVSQQSLRLTRTALLLVFGVAFYWLWSDLVAVFSYLDSMVLWHRSEGSGTNAVLFPISLSDVLIGFGSLTALSMMGVQWDKLQWVAGGLSVGIGFGMKEILSNFVSGIIILFERPVRIGDTVTIGPFSGTVSRIRIRATTLTDFDRKEVIIPNQQLMTERLINWSLSDTVTRVIVRVGVAYGSDLELTRTLLKQAADENSRVLKDPAPIVYFLTFGPSTLDHELRFFVSELGDRNPAVDELNRKIDALFKANGIEIAFNQMDVYIKNMSDGSEQAVEVSKPEKSDT
ncbi:TPA: mechanosensitive ion channel domain-containing protein [Aeromonas salmonicida subsp. salmonicida]|uniref:mechanosensitive ion channel domain-containing protein n=1 Tax=Aeromonas salmonicida TaxID=645 RepID=UPI00131FCB21|nr:mechanosensitive ion channel domain-containing protein [Aeromonas salmonicida]ELI6419118.1 mechanosensitive ion channel [Aeromonas salmonicida subsp. salmonicida]ELM3646933.1 mechanosensitive ion channel [Aeromonas salmonicida subsp. salmonicida]QHE43248.1 mechanosensitive ion channel [Aeromonas salmonicida subsp. salmonicida]QHE48657.1 mechanosensitive ion channel [Aeromonas salmonicida subsp. salmonicida]QJF56198.1 mechanosensitive ion channel [Aeromonas salmonicida subsp. salmonicida]